ncbi:nucleotide sugar dehydrogenase [Gimesia maris]|uniref:UDP-N-acetyl-D-glucosamine 6-dehydrogenase n=1 Tax=Gimesia maris TaxID=122 RepID=A0ABX5YGL5_9PLAN|nr:nucleotide sugar dehydrogenase [Gimesia maris]HAW28266.1 nucleotide sugar dehydrogenase [Planctomycetaceae bacterium]EDL61823.1 lipopolysaccharide biosynthesis protein [Gimesia maris DSM 8797]QDU12862.1 UDP-N-acetyl-D-glucosamine 6-dehydrogenase [Gimesia maris]QEG14795.1 UDP-N-acetyl-D-glucosamine 6-dehydrogenase [Gimesia maris]QGQ31814.1 nucleotide sugar dehydrogenase [Gimesia maris]|tara:strand:+ start:1333 stop:2652 length:1320 start_codon:yes stop_codon:yes gene_type:complete
MANQLEQAIKDKTATIGIIGLGYVGLPLIDAFVNSGFKTMGFDVDQNKVEQLQAGKSYIQHIPSKTVTNWLEKKQFEATAEASRMKEADALLICVPTPLTTSRDPDLSYVEKTTEAIAASLRPGQLVVLESTTYPTTTRDVLLPILEATGLKVGEDYFLAYSPEREDPGNPDFSAAGIPKVVGGIDDNSLRIAAALYEHAVVNVIQVSSVEIAEACKILENTYRAVNIAMVNELKTLFDRMNIDVWEVIDAAKTKPFGFQAFYPGPGLGGHCIPIDPFYLSWLARKEGQTTRFIELAGEVNTRMPRYVIDRLSEFLNQHAKPLKGSKICMLGVAYKKDVDDPRESPSFHLLDLLLERGVDFTYNDPHIPKLPKMRHHNVPAMESQELTPEYLAAQDCVLIATDHSAYDYDFIVKHSKMILDTRNATKNVTSGREKIFKA